MAHEISLYLKTSLAKWGLNFGDSWGHFWGRFSGRGAVRKGPSYAFALQPQATRDLNAAFSKEPALISEAANGRTTEVIRQLQLEADHHAWDKAQSRLAEAARSIETVVASALQARVQRYWVAGAAAAALAVGMILADLPPERSLILM